MGVAVPLVGQSVRHGVGVCEGAALALVEGFMVHVCGDPAAGLALAALGLVSFRER